MAEKSTMFSRGFFLRVVKSLIVLLRILTNLKAYRNIMERGEKGADPHANVVFFFPLPL